MDLFLPLEPPVEVRVSLRVYNIPEDILATYLPNLPPYPSLEPINHLHRSLNDSYTLEALQILFSHLLELATSFGSASLLTSLDKLYKTSQRHNSGMVRKYDKIFFRLCAILETFGAHEDLVSALSTFFSCHSREICHRGAKVIAEYIHALDRTGGVLTDTLAVVSLQRPPMAEFVLQGLNRMCMVGRTVSDATLAQLEALVEQQEVRKWEQSRREWEVQRLTKRGGRGRATRLLNGAELDPRELFDVAMRHPEQIQIRQKPAARQGLALEWDDDGWGEDGEEWELGLPRRKARRDWRRATQLLEA